MDGLDLRGFGRAHEAELRQVGRDEELSPTAVAILALLAVLPRPKGRPLGIGLQLSAPALAAVLGRSERMVHYALAQLEGAGLCKRFTQVRAVRTITRHRPLPLQRFAYVGKGGARRWTTKAHCTAVLYPTPHGLDVVARHGWTVRRGSTVRVGVVAFLFETLASWIRALVLRCASAVPDCTPYESKTSRDVPTAPSASAAAGKGGEERPSGVSLDAHRGQGAPPRGSAHEDSGRAAHIGGGGFSAEVERCWAHHVDVAEHLPPRAPRGMNLDRWRLGFGYEATPTGRKHRVWSPILTAAAWMPAAWARGTPDDRAVLEARFEPILAELERRIAAGAPAPEVPR